ncbi:MAG: hypothetical protein V5A44_09500 [Haloarculaceae archaeon]
MESLAPDNPEVTEFEATVESLAGTAADVVVLVGPDAEYLAVGAECDRSATDLVARATDAFGGGGGGSERIAQAGGLDATVAEVLALHE